jgi:GMP synthase-like glutamine amidotransferase
MIVIIDNTATGSGWYLRKLIFVLEKKNYKFIVAREISDIKAISTTVRIHAFILSGSELFVGDSVQVIDYVLNFDIPVIGICFGAQYIANYFGAHLERMPKKCCEPVSLIDMNLTPKFCILDIVRSLPRKSGLVRDASVMLNGQTAVAMFHHRSRPIYGMFFHPEALARTHHVLYDLVKTY